MKTKLNVLYLHSKRKKTRMDIYNTLVAHSRFALLIACFPFVLLGCSGKSGESDALIVAESFGKAYFNYDFKSALQYCTPESEKWLRFAASNIYEADVDMLRAMDSGAKVEGVDVVYADDDSTAMAIVEVEGMMVRDTVGRAGHVEKEGKYCIPVVKRQGAWRVKMVGLLRSER